MAEQLDSKQTTQVATAYGKTRYWYGITNSTLGSDDDVLKYEARRRLHTYRDLYRDSKVEAAMHRRKSMTTNAETRVLPNAPRGMNPRKRDKILAEMVEDNLRHLGVSLEVQDAANARADFPSHWHALQYGLLDAVLMGFASGELMYMADARSVYVEECKIRDQERFHVDKEFYWKLKTPGNEYEGIKLPSRKFLFYTYGSFWNPNGLGIGNKVFHPVMFKRLDMTFWLRMLDKYGGPTAVGKHPPGIPQTGEGSVQELLNACAAIQSEAAVAIPETQTIELLQAIQTAAQQGFDALARFLDDQIAQAILGVTLTTSTAGSKGTQALGETHRKGEHEVVLHDSQMLMGYLTNSLSRWITDYNYGVDEPAPVITKIHRDYSALREQASIDQILFNSGLRRTLASANELYGYGEDVYERVPDPPKNDTLGEPRPPEEDASDDEEGQGLTGEQDTSEGD